jgi:hypothetical protein
MELHDLPASKCTAPLTSAGSYLFSDPKDAKSLKRKKTPIQSPHFLKEKVLFFLRDGNCGDRWF